MEEILKLVNNIPVVQKERAILLILAIKYVPTLGEILLEDDDFTSTVNYLREQGILEVLLAKPDSKNNRDSRDNRDKNIISVNYKEIEDWIDDWRNLFNIPELKGSIGNRQNCLNRMKILIANYQYNKQQIFEASNLYLQECIDLNRYIKSPENFILSPGLNTYPVFPILEYINKLSDQNIDPNFKLL